MLLMHKESDYGTILLKQKFKQTDKPIKNFALQLAKMLPFDLPEIENGLVELLDENALVIDGDKLMCIRMIKDADLSLKRSLNGSKGGKETMKKGSDFAKAKPEAKPKAPAQAKVKANAEYENIIETVVEYLNIKASTAFQKTTKATRELIVARIKDGYTVDQFKTVIDKKTREWLPKPDMVVYLRPETLFGNKFEGYLNQIEAVVEQAIGKAQTAIDSTQGFMERRHGKQFTGNQ